MDFTKRAYTNYCVHTNGYGHSTSNPTCGDDANKEAGSNAPEVFTCPSTSNTIAPKGSQKDYCTNAAADLPERTNQNNATNGNYYRARYLGLFWANSGMTMAGIKDGTSHTFLLLEQSSVTLPGANKESYAGNPFISVGHWSDGFGMAYIHGNEFYAPNYLTANEDTRTPRSLHPGGLNAVMADGSVHFVSGTCDMNVYGATYPAGTHDGNKAGGGEALF